MMMTPKKTKGWSGWSLTPRSENPKSANPRIGDGSLEKGKALALHEASAPPVFRNGGRVVAAEYSPQEGGDLESLDDKLSRLENELFEYQYNMGILLLEKKKWTSECEDLQQALAEAKEILKREQAAHLIAVSDVEKREENLRKALGVEKQCALDLEKALRQMRAEYAEIKFTSDSRLAEANALATSIEEKSLEVESKLHQADAKLAEASRKSVEVDIKQKRLEARESELRRDRLSLNAEREAQESSFCKQREDLREWEQKLQEGEERLCEGRRILNQQEERVNEFERSYKQKERDLEAMQKKIEKGNVDLKNKEEELSRRYLALNEKEMEADSIKKGIERKERELQALEEKLHEREEYEIQKLLDEHKNVLDAKRQEFEMELNQKRKSVDDDLASKAVSVEKKEHELRHLEEKIVKREQSVEKKLEKFKEKQDEVDSKLKILKEKEKALKAEERKLDAEKKDMLNDKENLLSLTSELEQKKHDIEAQLSKIIQEKEQLKVTEEERLENDRLKSELKQEIEKCRLQKEVVLQEAESLRKERESFEKEWEALDDKKIELKSEVKNITIEKEKFDKWRLAEQERIKKEAASAESNIQREMETLKLSKETFAADMEHEKSLLAERAHTERSEMLNALELQKRKLEIEAEMKIEEEKKKLNEREQSFEEEREKEMVEINYLREVAESGIEEMKKEAYRVEKQKKELEFNKKNLEEQRLEIQKDIDQLIILSSKLKYQREQFLQERSRFISFVEKNEGCELCGEITREFVISDLQSVHELEGGEILPPLPKLAEDYMRNDSRQNQNNEMSPGEADTGTPSSGGKMSSWLRKCTSKIFIFSPTKKSEHTAAGNLASEPSFMDEPAAIEDSTSKRFAVAGDTKDLSLRVVEDSLNAQKDSSDNSIRAGEGEDNQDPPAREDQDPPAREDQDPSEIGESENAHDNNQEIQASQATGANGRPKRGRTGRRAVGNQDQGPPATEDQDPHGVGKSESAHNENQEFQPSQATGANGRPKRGRPRRRIVRTHTMKEVVDDAENILWKDGTGKNELTEEHPNGDAEDSSTQLKETSQDDSVLADRGIGRNGRKRRRPRGIASGQDVDGSEDTGVSGRHGKRRQKSVQSVLPPGERRYNLRRSTRNTSKDEVANDKKDQDDSIAGPVSSVGFAGDNGGSTNLMQDDVEVETSGGTIPAAEVNRTPERYREVNEAGEEVDDDDEGEDDEDEGIRPGEASIGKKLWTFLTT